MATISKQSLIYRWAYLWTVGREKPRNTDLCTLFWRCVLITPLLTTFAGAVVSGAGYGLYRLTLAIYHHWHGVLKGAGFVLAALAVGTLLVLLGYIWKPYKTESPSCGVDDCTKGCGTRITEKSVSAVWLSALGRTIAGALQVVFDAVVAYKKKSCTLYEVK